MTPLAAIETVGATLYGERWRAPLSRSLHRPGAPEPGVAERQLHYWLSTTRPVPAWVPSALVALLQSEAERRRETLGELANRIAATVD